MDNGINHITTAFFGFDDAPELEQKIRELLSPMLSLGMGSSEASCVIIDVFKQNGIDNVMFVADRYLGFWKIK